MSDSIDTSEAGGSTGPVTLITGGGSGIGAASARLLAGRGHRVVIAGRRPEPLAAVAAETAGLAICGDVATPQGARRIVDAALSTYGRIDGLVLNAGVMRPGTVAELSAEDWDESLRINLSGPFRLAQEALPQLLSTRGVIVGVSSIAALRTGPGAVAYSASKAGLNALIRGLAFDHGAAGIRANCVCPGWTRSEMSDAEMGQIADQSNISIADAYAKATAFVPQGRPAEPDEVAHAVAWLLSPQASYVNGASLVVDGGTILGDPGTLSFIPRPEDASDEQ